jgi:hypothetical protein
MAFDLPAPCSSDATQFARSAVQAVSDALRAAFRVLLPARDNAGHDRPAGPA